jgi:ketosteroid isomerase-like protein
MVCLALATASDSTVRQAFVSTHANDRNLCSAQASSQGDRAGIERLHQQDVQATLSGKADELAKLWDSEAVRLQEGGPAEVGRAAIYADDKRWEASANRGQPLSYNAEVKDLQIIGDWAFEWGYFTASYKEGATGKTVALSGKQLRVLKRQPDGSWKFVRVMSLIDSRTK